MSTERTMSTERRRKRILSSLHRLAAVVSILLCPLGLGCGSPEPSSNEDSTAAAPAGDHEHGDHEHGDHEHGESDADAHAGHDHPPHGPHGGHLLSLSPGGAHVEWDHRSDKDQVIVYAPELGSEVTSVKMRFQIGQQEPKSFSLEPADDLGDHAFQVTSPELLTAIQAGDAADVTLIVTSDGEERTAEIELHEH